MQTETKPSRARPDAAVLRGVTLAGLVVAALNLEAGLIVDSSFTPPVLEQPGTVALAAPAPDGKVFISGSFTSVSGQPRAGLARVLSDGRLDPGFDAGQVDYVSAMLPLSDGGLLAAARIRASDGQLRAGVLRLATNGTLDTNFVGQLPAGMTAYTLALSGDGKVIAGGAGGPKVVRLSADGTLDATFDAGNGLDGNGYGGNVNAVAVQPDGKVIVGGYFYYYDGQFYWPKLVRLNTHGTLDPSFDTPLSFWWDDFVYSLALRPDGKLWVAGRLEQVALWPNPEDVSGYRFRCVALLRPDGSVDGAFTNLFGLHQFVRSMTVQDDGRPVVAGEFYQINDVYHPSIARLNTNGTLDASFNPPLSGSPVVAYPGGRTLLCGQFHRGRGWSTSLVRLNLDGTVDEHFRVVTGWPAEVTAVARQSDGKWIVAGNFQLADGAPVGGLLRLNADGSRDTSFDAGSGPGGTVAGLAMLTNGQVLVAGSFATFDGSPCTSLARLHGDGRFDTNFTLAFGGVGLWYRWPEFDALAQAPDGRVTLTGVFSGPRYNLVRLNTDAGLDESFSPRWAFPESYPPLFWAGSLVLQSNGAVVVGGGFSDCGIADEPCRTDQNFGAMVRFDSAGMPDLSFDPLVGSLCCSGLTPLAALADRSVLARHGDWGNQMRKLLPNGAPDPAFRTSSTAGGSIHAALVQSDGWIVTAGSFNEFNGVPRQHLARLHPDGSVDSCFDPGASVDGAVSGILSQADGQWLLSGGFTSVGGVRRTGLALARWEDFCFRLVAEPGDGTSRRWIIIGPTNRLISLERSTDLLRWEPLATNTLSGEGWRIATSNDAPHAFYRARLLPAER